MLQFLILDSTKNAFFGVNSRMWNMFGLVEKRNWKKKLNIDENNGNDENV